MSKTIPVSVHVGNEDAARMCSERKVHGLANDGTCVCRVVLMHARS